MRRMAAAVVLLVLVLCGLLVWRLRMQDAHARGPAGGSGEIEATTLRLSARVTARIAAIHVKEGDTVDAGALLLTMDCAEPVAQLAEAQARVQTARAQAAAAVASVQASRSQKEASAAAQMAAKAQAEALAAQRDAAKRQNARLDQLAADVSMQSRDQSNAAAEGLEHQAQAALAQVTASAEQGRAAVAAISASGAQAVAAEAQLEAAKAAVQRAKLYVDECKVTAPRKATVETLPFETGELVPAGQPLARLVDLDDIKAVFYLANAEIGAAAPGGSARIVADAWPGETFTGSVRTVAFRAEFTPRNVQTKSDRDRLVYPIEVAVENKDGKLRPGMPVQVTLGGR